MLVNKPADYLAQVRQQLAGTGRPEDVPIVLNRLNDDLLVFYVFDTPDAMRTVMTPDLEKRRLDESSLHYLATRNLGAYFDKHGLTVGRAKVDLRFQREGDGKTRWDATVRGGAIEVEQRPGPRS